MILSAGTGFLGPPRGLLGATVGPRSPIAG
jgi:hypothetical protein